MDRPRYGDRWSPLRNPSTTVRASSSRVPIRARTSGTRKRLTAASVIGTPRASHSRPRQRHRRQQLLDDPRLAHPLRLGVEVGEDRKSTRLNSSHSQISYAVFCLKKKKKEN